MEKKASIVLRPLKRASSSITSVGHDPQTKTLAVKFSSGQTYHYHGVEAQTFNKLVNSESAGKFMQANVVGKYKHSKQDDAK